MNHMLLSMLADADYLSSAEHFDSSIIELVEQQHQCDALKASELQDALQRHIDDVLK